MFAVRPRTVVGLIVCLAVFLNGQTTYRYLKVATLHSEGLKYQEIDWIAGAEEHPNPHLTSSSSNGMEVWGDNAGWEIKQPYDGDPTTHAWVGDVSAPYTHEIYLDLGQGNGIAPEAIQITKPGYTSVYHFQCWVSNDLVVWELFLDKEIADGGSWSTETFPLALVLDTEAPSAPQNVVASHVTDATLNLFWKASTDNRFIKEYRIYQGETVAGTSPNPSFQVSGLTPETAYSFQVTAVDYADNESAGSTALSVSTCPTDAEAPAAPASLSAENITDTRADISWRPPDGAADVAGYVVYLDENPVGTTERTSFAIPGLKPSASYEVAVRAKDAAGNISPASTALTLETTAPRETGMVLSTNFWNVSWGGGTADPFADGHKAVSGDNPWDPEFLREIRPYATLRFMDWTETNGSERTHWNQRTRKDALIQKPMAYEWLIDLCNRLDKNMWFCVPHKIVSRDTLDRGTNNYLKKLAILVRTGVDMGGIDLDEERFANLAAMARQDFIYAGGTPVCEPLKPHLRLYIEYSNETWNFGFPQSHYCVDEGVALNLGGNDKYYAGRRFHAWAALRVFEEMEDVFGKNNPRLVRIDAIHIGGSIADHVLVYNSAEHNPRGLYPDAISPAPYFGHKVNGSASDAVSKLHDAIVSSAEKSRKNREDIDAAAAEWGTDVAMIAYEGGQHVTTNADVINRDPAMYDLYLAYLDSMSNYYEEFAHYAHSGAFSGGGAWGAKEAVGDDLTKAHKYRALLDWMNIETLQPVDVVPPTSPKNLTGEAGGVGVLVLSWDASRDVHTEVEGYRVYQNGVFIGFAPTISYTVADLNPSGKYQFSLQARDSHGNLSLMSDTLTVETNTAALPRVVESGAKVRILPSRVGLIVRNASSARSIVVHTLSGRRVMRIVSPKQRTLVIDRSHVAQGAYQARITDSGGRVKTVGFVVF